MSTFYPELCKRYADVLNKHPNFGGDHFNTQHLQWMLGELQTNTEMSVTKKHRWLGFIQGVLVCHGLITVNEERNFTRDIFKGA